MNLEHHFSKIAQWADRQVSRAHTSILNLLIIIIWTVYGYLYGFSEENLSAAGAITGFVSIILLFLMANANARTQKENIIMMKEILLALPKARNEMILVKDLTEEELQAKEDDIIDKAKTS